MLDPKIKATIDKMTVEEMLRRLRCAASNDPIFQHDTSCDYFNEQFRAKRNRLATGEYIQILNRVNREEEGKRK